LARERDGANWKMTFLYWLGQVVASAALAGIIAFVGLLFMLPSKIVNKRLNLWFDQQLEAFKGEQNKEIETLKEQLNHLTDRGRLSNEREYAATAKAWESYVDAHFATMQSVAAFINFPDLNALADEDLEEFLQSNEFSARQVADLRSARDKNRTFGNIMQLRLINRAGQALHDTRDLIMKQSVFIDRDLQGMFDQNLDRLTRAWAEERVNFGRRDAEIRTDRDDLLRNGEARLNALRTNVRDHLLRNLTPA